MRRQLEAVKHAFPIFFRNDIVMLCLGFKIFQSDFSAPINAGSIRI